MTPFLWPYNFTKNLVQPGSDSINGEVVPAARPFKTHFMDLATEIHILISQQLMYPDALSLKHTNRYLYNLVDTGVRLKVGWLVSRRLLHLECPNDRKCNLQTDLDFCQGSVS